MPARSPLSALASVLVVSSLCAQDALPPLVQPTVVATQVLSPCSEYVLQIRPLALGIELRPDESPISALPNPSFFVFGFRPVFAPIAQAPGCFLLPSPDIVVPHAAGSGQYLRLESAPLVGLQIYVQAAHFEAQRGFVFLSDGYRLQF